MIMLINQGTQSTLLSRMIGVRAVVAVDSWIFVDS